MRIYNLTTRPGQSLIQKLTNDLLWITNKFQITVQFEWVPNHSKIRNNEIVDQLVKKATVNEKNRLPDSSYTLLTYVKMSVRRSCLRN
jgi:ribonuclease HI